jgi:hypothetical protein
MGIDSGIYRGRGQQGEREVLGMHGAPHCTAEGARQVKMVELGVDERGELRERAIGREFPGARVQ